MMLQPAASLTRAEAAPAESRPRRSVPPPASALIRCLNLLAVILPFLGVIAAGYLMWGGFFNWVALLSFLGMYLATALGITVGYHRLFTHRSFETNWIVQLIFGALGSMAIQGPLIKWVAQHRYHHKQSDSEDDPHSPHLHGHGLIGLLRGMWHAHVGWFFESDAQCLENYVPDLMKNRLTRRISGLFPLWATLSLLIPAAVGWALSGTWTGAVLGLIWGGLVRIFFVHHVTWSINSICHLWGSQPFAIGDQSKNNFVFGVLAMGEGWHNNHHAFPSSARHGLAWWQIDVSYMVIRLLARLGLAWNIRVPSPQLVLATRGRRVNE